MFAEHALHALQGRADGLAQVDRLPLQFNAAGLQAGHVEEVGDEAGQALGLALDRGREFLAGGCIVEPAVLAQGRGRPGDGRQRGLQVMRERTQQGRPQPFGLRGKAGRIHLGGEPDALDGDGGLVDERGQQPLLAGVQRCSGPADPDCADRAVAGAQGQEQVLGREQGLGAPSRRPALAPGQLGSSGVDPVDVVVGRVGGPDLKSAIGIGEQDHHVEPQHRGDLLPRGPQQVVERDDPGDLAAEGVERLRRLGPARRRERRLPGSGGEMARDDCHDEEEEQGGDVGRIGHGEGMEGWDEEEVVGQRTENTGRQRRPEPVADRDGDDGGQEHQVDVLDAGDRVQDKGNSESRCDRHDGHAEMPWAERSARGADPDPVPAPPIPAVLLSAVGHGPSDSSAATMTSMARGRRGVNPPPV